MSKSIVIVLAALACFACKKEDPKKTIDEATLSKINAWSQRECACAQKPTEQQKECSNGNPDFDKIPATGGYDEASAGKIASASAAGMSCRKKIWNF